MSRSAAIPLAIASVISLATLTVWVATGRDSYTKFQVVEEVATEISRDDPFAATGFYDGNTDVRVVRRDEFRLGLLPMPQGLFDKHLISVVTIVLPVWLGFGLVAWRSRRDS